MTPALKKEMDKASSALDERNLGDARKHLQKALAIAPSNPDALYLLGVVEYTGKNVAEARKDFAELLARYPDHAGSLLMLGQIKLESGEKQEAVTLLEKAVEASPTKWLPHELLAYAYTQTGELEKARVEAEKTGELNKDKLPAMRLLEARILMKQKKYSEAHELLVAFLKEYPKDPGAKEAEEQLARFKAVPTQHPQ